MIFKMTQAALVCFAVAGCNLQTPDMSQQAEQMELALLECKVQLGLPGQTRTQVSFANGVPTAQVIPFDQINAADAARINACANGAATLDDGLMVVPMSSAAVPVAAVTEPVRRAGECPRGRSGLYGGTSYCFAGMN